MATRRWASTGSDGKKPLTHWGWVMHICFSRLDHHWFRQWLVTWSAPSHYLNQCWNIVNWALRNKLQGNFNRNSYIFTQENAFQDVVWKMAAILSQPQCVNWTNVKYNQWGLKCKQSVYHFVQISICLNSKLQTYTHSKCINFQWDSPCSQATMS